MKVPVTLSVSCATAFEPTAPATGCHFAMYTAATSDGFVADRDELVGMMSR